MVWSRVVPLILIAAPSCNGVEWSRPSTKALDHSTPLKKYVVVFFKERKRTPTSLMQICNSAPRGAIAFY